MKNTNFTAIYITATAIFVVLVYMFRGQFGS